MKYLIAIAIVLISLTARADFRSDILRCQSIEGKNERLDCYDGVAQYYKDKPLMTAAVPPAPASSTSSVAAVTPQAEPSTDDAFGKERMKSDEVAALQSYIVGEVKGWRRGQKFTLGNGQVWQFVSSWKGSTDLNNPKVTIEKGFFGSYDMKIEGLNARAKVKRVE